MSGVTPVSTVGSKKRAAERVALAADGDLGALRRARRRCAPRPSRPPSCRSAGRCTAPCSKPLPTFSRRRRLGERLRRTRRRRRPARGCGWRRRRSGRCCGISRRSRPSTAGVEIGVVEHDERARCRRARATTFFTVVGALRHQQLADLGRAGEGELAHDRVRRSARRRSRVAPPVTHDEHALRHAGALGELAQRQRRERRLASPASAPSCSRRRAPGRPCA